MATSENKTQFTGASVAKFIAAVENETRRADAKALAKLFAEVTGFTARMWGPTIIGYGVYRYTYESGRSGESVAVGFSPRKDKLVLYWGKSGPTTDALLAKLGRFKTGGGCLYVGKLADVDLTVLEKLVKTGLANRKKEWPVTAR
jgi:hypothetical protein